MTIKDIAKNWHNSGIQNGDTVLIHSSLKRTLEQLQNEDHKITPINILESLLDAVGSSGTLLLPLFNFDFTKGVCFDVNKTPSHMGALTEAARQHPDAVRTGHPIYSFAAIGAKANKFAEVNNYSGYGEDSPFAILKKLGGKIAVLDLPDQHSMTFYHYVEEQHKVPYRYHKQFTGEYTDKQGISLIKSYSLFVRDLAKGVETYVNPMGELLWKHKLYTGNKPHQGSGMRTIDTVKLYDFVSKIIISGKAENLLYTINKKN